MTALSSKSVAWHDDAASDGAESEGTQDVTDAFDSFSMGGHYAQPSADSVSGFEDRPERSAPSQRRIKKANRLRERFGIPADEVRGLSRCEERWASPCLASVALRTA